MGALINVSLRGNVVMQGAPPAFHVSGRWHVADVGGGCGKRNSSVCSKLGFMRVAPLHGTDAVYGKFSGETTTWSASGVPVETFYKVFAQEPTVIVLGYSFPLGANGTNNPGKPGVIAGGVVGNFPSFRSVALKNVLSWEGTFVNAKRGRTMGASGGPSVFHDSSGTLVVSPLNEFKTTGETDTLWDGTPAAWVPGTAGTVGALPPGFRHEFVVFSGGAGMVTDTLYQWGQGMQARHGSARLPDPTLQTLSYQTDNGGQYCFCKEDCDRKLLDVAGSLRDASVPVGLMSFQGGWWDNPNIHTARCAPWCVTSWEPNHTKVPMGVKEFQHELGLPLQLYAPYFCADSPYAQRYEFLQSDITLPGCGGSPSFNFTTPSPAQSRDFYTWFMKLGLSYGMVSFEPDFMLENFACIPDFISKIGASEQWLAGMGDAAHELGLPVQLCMATPTDVLTSMSLPAVTNFRASNDYFYGTSWDIGLSSLLIWALGFKPSKDTFWTTGNGGLGPSMGGCPSSGCPKDHSPGGYELHAILATLSTGPVGFSDALHHTNATLIRRTCTAAGSLLQPSKPATAVDSSLSPTSGAQPPGHVLATFSGASTSDVWSYIVVSHQLTTEWQLTLGDLWPLPDVPASGLQMGLRFDGATDCAHGQPSDSCVRIVDIEGRHSALADLPAAPSSEPFAASLLTMWPVCGTASAHEAVSGWVLLGELDKFVTVSPSRFGNVTCGQQGDLRFHVLGDGPREVVDVTVVSVGGAVAVLSVPVSHGSAVHVVCSGSSCQVGE